MDPDIERSKDSEDILSRVPAPLPGRALQSLRHRSHGSFPASDSHSGAVPGSSSDAKAQMSAVAVQQPVVCDWILGSYVLVADDPDLTEAQPVLTLDNWEVSQNMCTSDIVSAVVGKHEDYAKETGIPPGRTVLNVHNIRSTPPALGSSHAKQEAVRTVRDYVVNKDALTVYYDKAHVAPLNVAARNDKIFPVGKPVIVAATLRHLIAAMTSWTNNADTALLVDVLLTFRNYFSASRLFELLQSRFEYAAQELASSPNHTLTATVLQNTHAALVYWVKHYYHTDFRGPLGIRLSRWSLASLQGQGDSAVLMTAQQLILDLQANARAAAERPTQPSTEETIAPVVQSSPPQLHRSRSISSLRSRFGSLRRQKQRSVDETQMESQSPSPNPNPNADTSPSRVLRLRKSLRRMRRITGGSHDSALTASPGRSDSNASSGSPRRLLSRSRGDTNTSESPTAFSNTAEQDDVAQMEAALLQLEERIGEDKRRENLLYPAPPVHQRPHAADPLPSPRNALLFSLRTEYVAQLLDSLETEFLRSIGWLEVVDMSWDQPQTSLESWSPIYRSFINRSIDALTGRGAPPQGGALVLIARFNVACSWIASQVVQTTTLAERARLVAKWIMVAWHCYCHGNIASVCQIMFALQLPAIARLSYTWDELTEWEKRVFDDLRLFVSPLDNFKHLRDHMQMHLANARNLDNNTPYIPFFGLFVADLASNDTLASYTDSTLLPNMMPLYDDPDMSQSFDALINVFRMRTKAAITREFLLCQQLVPTVTVDSSEPYYAEAWQLESLPDDEITRLSELMEPSGSDGTRISAPVVIGSDALHSLAP